MAVFDPFGDYQTKRYLRNLEELKDDVELKFQEHAFFESNLEEAFVFLRYLA